MIQVKGVGGCRLLGYLIMQLRLSNGNQAPFTGSIPHYIRRQKQQAIFTYNSRDNPMRNVYYDNNPYFLHSSPSEPQFKNLIATSRNSSRSRECLQTNSQRSGKVVRANGLRLIEKPVIGKGEQSPMSNGRLNDQTRRFMQREMELEGENKVLRGENEYLKQKVRGIEEAKAVEIKNLNDKIQFLMRLTQGLEAKMQTAESEWRQEVRKLRQHCLDDL